MVVPDGKKYPVPANYASKSKLVEGDTLKLTIAEDGSLIYKQIKPVERKNLIGTLTYDNGNYTVLADGKTYKVLFASVTYYKGEPGGKASVIVPADKESTWAALESIIHEHDGSEGGESKEEKPQKPEKKIELPEENKEILEEVKESFEKEKEPKAKEDLSTKPKKEVVTRIVPKVVEPETTEEMTVKEASQASATEETAKLEVPDEHPDIKKQGAYLPEEDSSIGKEEKDENSLGEEPPNANTDDKGIAELEI